MKYQVSVSHEAEKTLDPFDPRLSAPLTERLGVRKSRVGGWRILFTVDRDAMIINIAAVDTRGQVYKH